MSAFIRAIVAKAKENKKKIVLPEGNDPRILEAAERILAEDVAELIIIGDPDVIAHSGRSLEKAHIIDPNSYERSAEMAELLYETRKHKGMTPEQAEELVKNVLYLGVLLVKAGIADGMVAGACHLTGDVLRPSLQILKTAPDAKLVSSFIVLCVPDCEYGVNGTFVFSDCGLEVHPNSEHLAQIAISSAASFRMLVHEEPIVAMLSHSTYGSAHNEDSLKVVEATRLAKEAEPDLILDGEMQLDAALIDEVAKAKAPGSPVAGRANVLIFPDLDSGNIGYKLVHRLAKAEAYGPVTQGIAKPVNDLSRGCDANGIYGVIAITCVQAQHTK